jgi:Dolichyl-phosphate-mannose-protein mannosyltransferase
VPRVRSIPAWGALAGLVAASTLLRFWAGTRVTTPWINPDEIIYGEAAKSLYREGSFRLLGQPLGFLSLVYPAVVGPLLALGDLERWYHWTKLLQALVMSLAAVPAYLWTRELASRGWALVAAVLTLALPGLVYSGLLMTEVAFYPVVLVAAWTMARALERPSGGNQTLLVLAVAVAALTRLQAFVLVPVFLTAVLLFRSRRDAVRLLPGIAGLLALCAAWAGYRLRDGGPLSRVFAGYGPAGHVHYAVGDALRFTAWHAADIVLFTGVFPACALVLLWATRAPDRALRAYLAVATALPAWFALEVGVFASRQVGYLAERNMIPLAPVLFVGFCAWLARGAHRPAAATTAAAAGTLLLVAYLPVERLATSEAFPNSFTLLPLIKLATSRPGANLDLLVTAAVGAGLVLFALVPRRSAWVLPTLVAVAFAADSVWASREVADRAAFLQLSSTGPDRRWVDRSATGATAYLYIGETNWPGAWENVFWNRRIVRVYDLLSARVPGGLPQDSLGPLPDGRLVRSDGRPAEASYLVSQYPVELAGKPVATAGDGLVLWRLAQPPRMSVWTQRAPGFVHVLVYACARGELRLRIVSASPGSARISVNRRLVRTLALPAHSAWRGSIAARPPAPPRSGMCTFDVESGPELQVLGAKFVRR